MATCGSLQHIFEKNPLPEKPSLIESLSPWNQIKPVKPVDQSSFIEMFGELHFKETSQSFSSSSSSSSPSSSFPMSSPSSSFSGLPDLNIQNSDGLDVNNNGDNEKSASLELIASAPRVVISPRRHARSDSISSVSSEPSGPSFKYTGSHNKSDSFSSMNSESLQLCTEGLGFESSDDVEDLKNEMTEDWRNQKGKASITKRSPTENNPCGEFRRSRSCSGSFPPPISCIGKSGKPWVCFKSYRHNGRFVLKEIRMRSQEFLHACREDGRLKLQFVHPNDDIQELEDEDCEEDEELDDEEDIQVDEEDQDQIENGSHLRTLEKSKTEANTRSYEAGN